MIPRMKVTVPRHAFTKNAEKGRRAIETALDAIAEDARIDFNVTTQTWNNRPVFLIRKRPGVRDVYTLSSVYLFVSRGTRPHPIRAIRKQALAFFRSGFRAKTRRGWIGSNQGARADKDFTLVKSVNHPGSEGRDFEETIARKWERLAPPVVQRALDAVLGR